MVSIIYYFFYISSEQNEIFLYLDFKKTHALKFLLHEFFITYKKIPKCSNNILVPIKIKISPPINSAFFSYLFPNVLPIFTPNKDNIKVMIPILVTDNTILVCKMQM